MRLHEHFEWDLDKAEANVRKHHVTFFDAAAVLADDNGDVFHCVRYDGAHSNHEERWITVGSDPDDRTTVLSICWTDRSTIEDQTTRIISARLATPAERKQYEAPLQ
jgi:uncharacterized DUF497 family protein